MPEAHEAYVRLPQTRLVKFGKRIRRPLDRLFAWQSRISTEKFIDPADVPGISPLRDNWRAIRDEAIGVMSGGEEIPPFAKISPDHRRIAPDAAWKSYFLNGYGYTAQRNRARCPLTAQLVDQVPNLVVAFFSIFSPGTHIKPHSGVTKAMLNVHLGLSIPPVQDRCELRVGDETRRWQEGEFLIFDETNQHEAWNESDQPRVVLFLQVARPMRPLGRVVWKACLAGIRHSSYVQDVRRELA